VLPAKGPVATRQFTSVSQASPIGSARVVCSGKIGESECEPKRRGVKGVSMRKGTRWACSSAASGSGLGRKLGNKMPRSKLRSGLGAGEEAFEAAKAFVYTF